MTNTNYVDKTYLALELTKIAYSDRQGCMPESIYSTFNYFLKELTNIDDLGIIEDYKNEIEHLRKQNKLLSSENQKLKSSYNSYFKTRLDSFKEYVNNNGGNMEPEVKKQLLRFLDTIFD